LEGMEEVVLANPRRTRLIADAQIKTVTSRDTTIGWNFCSWGTLERCRNGR